MANLKSAVCCSVGSIEPGSREPIGRDIIIKAGYDINRASVSRNLGMQSVYILLKIFSDGPAAVIHAQSNAKLLSNMTPLPCKTAQKREFAEDGTGSRQEAEEGNPPQTAGAESKRGDHSYKYNPPHSLKRTKSQ
jgi:hypothetical protein